MPRFILIETSTALCSTALVEDGKIVSFKESAEPRQQAALTAVFVKEMLDGRGLKVTDCDAVCVSSGPGSYTGLRVGVSTAKGLCFGAGIPLIAIDTMEILFNQAADEGLIGDCRTVIPAIDARRMEIYAATYDASGERRSGIAPVIIGADSYAEERAMGPVLFIGDGAQKCAEAIGGNVRYSQECPNAKAMLKPALKAWDEKRFENTAYFEPFYLKQFVATVSHRNVF